MFNNYNTMQQYLVMFNNYNKIKHYLVMVNNNNKTQHYSNKEMFLLMIKKDYCKINNNKCNHRLLNNNPNFINNNNNKIYV